MTNEELVAKSMAIIDYDDFNRAVDRAEMRGVFYYGNISPEEKAERITAERDGIMFMSCYQHKLLSEVTTSMTYLLDNGATLEDLDDWTEDAIYNAKVYNNRSTLCKIKDFIVNLLFPFKE